MKKPVVVTDDIHEQTFLAACQKIYRQHEGCTTPFEDLFVSLVFQVQAGRGPTPDDVARELDNFRERFESMAQLAHRFSETYSNPLQMRN